MNIEDGLHFLPACILFSTLPVKVSQVSWLQPLGDQSLSNAGKQTWAVSFFSPAAQYKIAGTGASARCPLNNAGGMNGR